MSQKGVEVSVIALRAAILRVVCSLVVIACFVAPRATVTVKAQTRYIASPVNWFLDTKHVDDKMYPDYVVDFEIPADATNAFVYTTTAGKESRVLAFSTVIDPFETRNGKKVVRVITGYRARKCSSSYNPAAWTCNYNGSIYQWACALRVRYYR